ncbi:UNVERIFIED_CONTAM: hypothetical protein FKN15_043385 [Acipenser sinensis]
MAPPLLALVSMAPPPLALRTAAPPPLALGTAAPPLLALGTAAPPLLALGTAAPPLLALGTAAPPLPALGTAAPPLLDLWTAASPLLALRMAPPLLALRMAAAGEPAGMLLLLVTVMEAKPAGTLPLLVDTWTVDVGPPPSWALDAPTPPSWALDDKERHALHGPVFTQEPSDITFPLDSENRKVFINCKAQGNPLPEYRWKINGRDIDLGMDYHYSLVEGNLLINNPDKNRHGGTYQCFASNSFGTIVSREANVQFAYTESMDGTTSTDSNMPLETEAEMDPDGRHRVEGDDEEGHQEKKGSTSLPDDAQHDFAAVFNHSLVGQ